MSIQPIAIPHTKKNTFIKQSLLSFFLMFLLVGCASSSDPNYDPFETFNRQAFALNEAIDKVALKPIAKGYDFITPKFIQDIIHSFFDTVHEVPNLANNLLQLNFPGAGVTIGRLLVNGSVGLILPFDLAGKIGLKQYYSDFGLTLARWGIKESPYLMVPFWGPSTLRDITVIPMDHLLFSPLTLFSPTVRNILWGVSIIDHRTQYLPYDELYNQAFDRYVFIRTAYMEHRRYLIKIMDTGLPITDDMHPEVPEGAVRHTTVPPMRLNGDNGDNGTAADNGTTADNGTATDSAQS